MDIIKIDNNQYTLEEKIFAETVKLLYSHVSAAILGAIFTASCIMYGLSHAVPKSILYSWYVALLIVSAMRFSIVKAYQYANPLPNRAFTWYLLFVSVTIASGIVWMFAGTMLGDHGSLHEILITFGLAGIAAGSVPFFSASRFVACLFILMILPAYSIKMLMETGATHQIVGVLSVVFMMVLLASIFYIHKAIYAALKFKFENDDLIHQLSQANHEVAYMNNELQTEITERKQVELLLRNSEEQYRLVTNALPVLIAYIDTDFHFRFNNTAYAEWFNKPMNEINGHSIKDVFGAAVFSTFVDHYQTLMTGKQVIYETTMAFHEDQERYVSVTLIPHFRDHVFNGVFSLISDMTPRINYLATHDPLTDLPNRSLFNARLVHTLKHAQHESTRAALFFLDLDHFKNINDTLGHDVGDQLLVKVVERLKECVRDTDTIARIGGDEFTIILEKIPSIQFVMNIAERICKAISQVYRFNDRDLFITTSMGISIYPNDGDNMQILLKNADMAMYRAKERGRNKFEFFTQSMNQAMQKKTKIEANLRTALEKNEFEVYFQPLIDVNNMKITSLEALLRWKHPDMGMVAPSEFIPVAEDSNLIVPIGEWVLHNACERIQQWHQQGYAALRVAVNLSARQFLNHKLVQVIGGILHATGLDGKYLTLELTESLIMSDIENSIKIVNGLKELNIKIAIDDFGTGYSSLSYLKRFPIDIIKIDKSFITDFAADHHDAAIVKAIIAMAHTLKMKVVAEGVEKPDQLAYLKEFDCDEIQGYLLCPPVSARELTPVLNKQYKFETLHSPEVKVE